MGNDDLKRLAGLVKSPDWDQFLVYLTNLKAEAHSDLEECSEVRLKALQERIRFMKELLSLRETVIKIMNVK